MSKLTYQEVKDFIEGEEGNGCKLLSIEYIDSKTKLQIQCACGEVFEKSFNTFKRQKQCPKCGKENGRLKHLNKIKCNCDYCGEEIELPPSRYDNQKHHFCNSECMGKWMSENKIGEKIKCNCDYCGEEIYKKPSEYKKNKHHFCNAECQGKWRSKNHIVIVYCDYCSEEIEITKYEYDNLEHHFCNSECYSKWCSENRAGENHPRFGKEGLKGKDNPRYNRIECECDYCHKKITVPNYDYKKNKHNFCNSKCMGKWCSENRVGENNPNYNPNITDEEREKGRIGINISNWRKQVYERDNYTCQCCGNNKGGNLNAHHLNSYNCDKEHRTDILNGIVLCEDYHKELHSIYGYGNNTIEQFREFLYNKYLQTKDIKYLVALEDTDIRKYAMKLNDKEG